MANGGKRADRQRLVRIRLALEECRLCHVEYLFILYQRSDNGRRKEQ
jgi:hypothetical protein